MDPDKTSQTDAPFKQMIGQIIDDRFRLESIIGQGGLSTVYKATHLTLGQTVAVKILRVDTSQEDPTYAGVRFKREAQAISSLSHDNIIRIMAYGITADGINYLAVEYVEGMSLAEILLKNGPLSLPTCIDMFCQILDAIGYAHTQGVIHRDIKPSNIIIAKRDDGSDHVKVIDFGIAKFLPESGKDIQRLTQSGQLFGTPFYMSPEQVLGKSLDGRSDIYSIGSLLFEALAGRTPFGDESPMVALYKQVHDQAPALLSVTERKDLPEELELLIACMLDKDPLLRPATAEEVARMLKDLPDKPRVSSTMTGLTRRQRKTTTAQSLGQKKVAGKVWINWLSLAAAALLVVASGALIYNLRIQDTRTTQTPVNYTTLDLLDQSERDLDRRHAKLSQEEKDAFDKHHLVLMKAAALLLPTADSDQGQPPPKSTAFSILEREAALTQGAAVRLKAEHEYELAARMQKRAVYLWELIIAKARAENLVISEAIADYHLGNNYAQEQNYDQALQYFKDAIRIIENTRSDVLKDTMWDIYLATCQVITQQKQPDRELLEHCLARMELYNKDQDSRRAAITSVRARIIAGPDPAKATPLFEKALALAKQSNMDLDDLVHYYCDLAQNYVATKRYKEARNILEMIIAQKVTRKDRVGGARVYEICGDLESAEGHYAEAISDYRTSRRIILQQNPQMKALIDDISRRIDRLKPKLRHAYSPLL